MVCEMRLKISPLKYKAKKSQNVINQILPVLNFDIYLPYLGEKKVCLHRTYYNYWTLNDFNFE